MYSEYFYSAVKASYWIPHSESSAELIDSTLFTHLFCAFADLDAQTNEVVISGAFDYQFSTFTNIVKQKDPHVQTLLSIGGRNADKSAFASMASNPTFRSSFIWSSIWMARTKGFRGLDLAWEYPSNDVEMNNFGKLIKEWREAIEDEAERTELDSLLLTAAVYYSLDYNSVSYPIYEIQKNLDWVNIIAYDFDSSSTSIGSPVATYDPTNPEGLCGDSGLKQRITAGIPEKKVVFGFPYVVSQLVKPIGNLSSSQEAQDVQATTCPFEADQPKHKKRKTCEEAIYSYAKEIGLLNVI